jgi:ATP-dependent RNA helicase SUPV3L1/SUV3
MSGYRNAGDRAIRVDMLERLADLLRSQDSKSGFECNSDMLSITGMTLEQFAGLMVGLGYKAEKGSRLKVVLENENETKPSLLTVEENEHNGQDYPNEVSRQENSEGEISDLNEVFYKFSWVPNKVNKSNKYSQKNGKQKKKKGKPLSAVRAKDVQTSSKNFGKKDKPIDPDNPFAKALMGFNRDN